MRKFYFLSLIICLSIFLYGCTQKKNVSITEIINTIESEIKLENMTKGNSKSLKRFFGLNSSDFKSFVIYTPSYTMDVSELLIIQLNNQSQADFVKDAIENRVDSQIATFGSYGPTQCALLEDYELKQIGDYIFYSVSKDSSTIAKAFKKTFK